MELFTINCTTCRARLKVREQSAIGQIVNCPKCGCMLQIIAPPGWQPPVPQAAAAAGPAHAVEPARGIEPAQAMASILAAAEAAAPWRAPASEPAAVIGPAAGFSPPPEVPYFDPQAVRVDPVAAAPAALPATPNAWLPVAKDCIAVCLPWACVPLAGMFSAWVVGLCLRSEVPSPAALAPAPESSQAAAASPLATPTMPVNDQPLAASVPLPAAPVMPAVVPAPQPKIEPRPSTADLESQQPRVALRPIMPSLDMEAAARSPSEPPEPRRQSALPGIKPQPLPSKTAARVKPPTALSADRPSMADRPPVDVAQALATRIASLDLPSVPLVGFVQLASGLTGVPITLDADACRELAIKLDTPLAVHEHDVSLGELLKHALEPHGLMAEVAHGHLIITASAAHRYQLQSVRYTVSDLNDTPTALAGWIEQLVAPQRWIGEGGAGRVDIDGPQLIVLQTPRMQHEVMLLLDKLRLARGKPAKGELDPFEVSLETPAQQMAAQLDTRVSVNYRQPAELKTVVRDLAQEAGVRLLIDWQSLDAAGCRPQSLASLVIDQQPLAAALDQLLDPLDLSYRVVAPDTLEVASQRALRSRPELELYPVRQLLSAMDGAQAPVDAIRQWLAAQLPDMGWGGAAAWRFDRQSSCLFVRTDAMSQRAIEAELRLSADEASRVRESTSAANPASTRP